MLRQPRPSRVTRILTAAAVIAASCMAPASDEAWSARACAVRRGPSKLDYLVLASIADSPHVLTMASYRTAAVPPAPAP
jgi:hypothetical protein